jgi:hypothetical protein
MRLMDMKSYVWAFVVAGVIIPVLLHTLAAPSTPWWPDAITLGMGFGAAAIVIVWKTRKEREMNRRLWRALKK